MHMLASWPQRSIGAMPTSWPHSMGTAWAKSWPQHGRVGIAAVRAHTPLATRSRLNTAPPAEERLALRKRSVIILWDEECHISVG